MEIKTKTYKTTLPTKNDEIVKTLQFIRSKGVGPALYNKLVQKYGSIHTVFDNLSSLRSKLGSSFVLFKEQDALKEYEETRALGADFLPLTAPPYPEILKSIHDPPPLLSIWGDVSLLEKPAIAIIGARDASLVAKSLSEDISQDLSRAGWCIVSGLARGIDTAAHKGALKRGTVAVIAGGLTTTYPPENKDLQDAIKQQGLLISESSLHQAPHASLFPRRNRIIAGLSQGVLVIEAGLKSGSLITARIALAEGRDIFAVPGFPLDPRSRGTNNLIKEGALLVESVEDILSYLDSPWIFGPKSLPDKKESSCNPPHKLVMENLSKTPIGVDELARECQMSAQTISQALVELELENYIMRHPGNKVSRL